MSSVDHVIAGAAAGVLVTAVFHPLEVAGNAPEHGNAFGAT